MKTLYVSDLDGTLLRSDETLSQDTIRIINALVGRGMLFSYATARSYQTARRVTSGLDARIPLIVYNGAMVVDNTSGAFLIRNFFGAEVRDVIGDLIAHEVYPIVYAFRDGTERFSYLPERCTDGMKAFLATRSGDPRDCPAVREGELLQGEIFYLTCIGDAEKLEPLYEAYKDAYHCVYHIDLYTKEPWLEIMPKAASKANAVLQLKKQLGCGRLVVFGDGRNDIDMFAIADEAYAMENAVDELKRAASGVIGSNDGDGVAKWLAAHVREE